MAHSRTVGACEMVAQQPATIAKLFALNNAPRQGLSALTRKLCAAASEALPFAERVCRQCRSCNHKEMATGSPAHDTQPATLRLASDRRFRQLCPHAPFHSYALLIASRSLRKDSVPSRALRLATPAVRYCPRREYMPADGSARNIELTNNSESAYDATPLVPCRSARSRLHRLGR